MSQQSNQAPASVTKLSLDSSVVITEDEKKKEEWEPQSLEEALLGE